MHQLAEKLAPGRSVRRIILDFEVDSIAKAWVYVQAEEGDCPLITQLVEETKPDVAIITATAAPQ